MSSARPSAASRDAGSCAYWRALFDQAVDPLLVYPLDAEGRPLPYVEVNEAALALYGYSREEMLERSVYDLTEAERPTVDAAIASLRERPDVLFRGHHRHRSGQRIPVEVHARLIDLDGRPAVLAIVRDLRLRLQAEAEARARERWFAEVLVRTSDDVLVLDRDWRILHLNPAATAAIGPQAEGAEGKVFWEAFPQLVGTEAEGHYRRAMEAREPVTFEALGALTGRYVEVRLYPTEEGLVVLGRDFTGRNRAEHRQRHQSERLRALAEASLGVTQAASLEDKLQALTEAVRRVVRAHQAVVSLTQGPDWRQAINAVSLSEKYAAWQGYDRPPDGSGIYAEVCRTNRPMRLTQEELEAHPLWRGFGPHAHEHPPMNGWLAVPLVGGSGENLGLLQASDKEDGAFTENDEAALVQLAQFASAAIEAARAEEARLEAAERFRVIVRQALVGVAQVDLQGRFTYVNDRFADIVGYAPEELLGLSMQEITHPEDLPRNLPSFQETAAGGSPFIIEKRYVRKDGTHVWVNNTVGPLMDAGGHPFAVLAVVLDVTERRAQEEALRENEMRLRLALEAAALGAIEIDLESGAAHRSDRYNQIFGYEGAAPVWTRELVLQHVLPEDREAVATAYEHARDTLSPWHFVCRIRRTDGAVRWIEAQGAPLPDPQGGTPRMIGLVADITERREQEEALRDREARFRLLAEAVPQKVFTADASGETDYVNEAWMAFTGQSSEEIRTMGWETLIHPDDVEENRRTWFRAVAEGAPYEFEHRFRRHDGAWRWHITRALPMRDASGEVVRWIGSNTEVHDLKATQRRLGFLVDLDRATRAEDDPAGVMTTTARMLGEHLGAHRCLYAEVDADEDRITVLGDYTRGTFGVAGGVRISDFGEEALRVLRAGEPFVFSDAASDPRVTSTDLAAYRRSGAAAAVCVPLLRAGQFVAAVAVYHRAPRVWSEDEVETVRTALGRAWEALLRARALRELRASEARYRALTELAPQLVYTARPDGSIDYYNQEWFDYTGMTPDDPFDDWVLAVHPDHRQRAHEAFLAAIEAGTDYEAEIPIRRRDGTHRWHLDRARPIRDEDGTIIRWIGVAVDTHDRIEGQRQLEALNASLEERVAERTAVAEGQARQIRRLAAELTRAEQRERRRIATALHDNLQQLLAAARFHLQPSVESKPALARVDDLLAESIEVSRSLTVQLSPPVLHESGLGAGLAWLARWVGETHGLEVALTVDPAAEPEDEHVRVLLFEAVRELLFNTAKHAGVQEASVTVAPEGPHTMRITVRDAGVGFPTAAPTTHTLSGLGLPSIRERLGYVGGEVAIQSRPGQGTLVTLIAPRTAPHSSPTDAAPPKRDAATRDEVGDPLVRSIRVLLVDDHQILRAGLTSLLRDESGIEIVGEAEDGVEAVDLALTLEPDVILMDVTMPRMGGIEATRRITAKLSNVRIIGLSMHTEADMAARLREAGAVAYITKGGPPALLVRTIREVSEPE